MGEVEANDMINGNQSGSDDSAGNLMMGSPEETEFLVLMAEEAAKVLPAPRRALKARVLKAVLDSEHESEKADSVSEPSVIRANEGEWLDSGFPGITMKLLHQIEDPNVEQGHKRYSVLARLVKGARYPHHRHVGYEECLVLEGDLHVNALTLHGGDFILTPDGSEHVETYTEDGCLLLLSTLLEDEILGA